MKRFVHVFLFILASSRFAIAQFTIGPEKLPAVGDRHVTTAMDTTGVSEGLAGANRSWNFAGLTPTGSSETIQYVAASTTPYANHFPGANLASYNPNQDTTYTYASTASGRYTILGIANWDLLLHYTDPEIQMVTPCTFGTNFSDTFGGQYDDGNGFVLRNHGTIAITGDGYGTIILPNGQTHQALRLKFVRSSTDSMFFQGTFMQVSVMTTTSYEWFIPSHKFPVLQVAYHTMRVGTVVNSTKLVEYNAPTASDVEIGRRAETATEYTLEQNFPNPFNPTTTIAFSIQQPSFVSLKVYNMLGQEVATVVAEELHSGSYSVPFEATGLASGTYLYRLEAGKVVRTRKMTVMK